MLGPQGGSPLGLSLRGWSGSLLVCSLTQESVNTLLVKYAPVCVCQPPCLSSIWYEAWFASSADTPVLIEVFSLDHFLPSLQDVNGPALALGVMKQGTRPQHFLIWIRKQCHEAKWLENRASFVQLRRARGALCEATLTRWLPTGLCSLEFFGAEQQGLQKWLGLVSFHPAGMGRP